MAMCVDGTQSLLYRPILACTYFVICCLCMRRNSQRRLEARLASRVSGPGYDGPQIVVAATSASSFVWRRYPIGIASSWRVRCDVMAVSSASASASASLVLAVCLTEEQDEMPQSFRRCPRPKTNRQGINGVESEMGLQYFRGVRLGSTPKQSACFSYSRQERLYVRSIEKEFPSVASKGCSREADKSTVGSSPRPPAELIDRISFTLADCDDVGPINPSGWSLALISVPSGCALAGREPATRNAVCGHGQSDKPMAKLKSLVAPSNSPYSARHCRGHLRPAG